MVNATKQINKITRLIVHSKRNYWSVGFPKRSHSSNKIVAGASHGYPTNYSPASENSASDTQPLIRLASDESAASEDTSASDLASVSNCLGIPAPASDSRRFIFRSNCDHDDKPLPDLHVLV
ncbi:hypothetical protein LXL04_023379 [Taraxacum kok-saghyz]